MDTGDIVLVTGHVWTVGSNRTTLREATYNEPRKALLLGKSKRFTGTRHGGWDESGYLVIAETHDVWMVMLLASGNRYRAPIAVREAQIQQQPHDGAEEGEQ